LTQDNHPPLLLLPLLFFHCPPGTILSLGYLLLPLLLPAGTILSLVYLLLLGALAGAIPVIFELAGCLLTLGLKLAYDHTQWGRQQQAQQAAEMEQQLCEAAVMLDEQLQQQQQQHTEQQPCDLPAGNSGCRSSLGKRSTARTLNMQSLMTGVSAEGQHATVAHPQDDTTATASSKSTALKEPTTPDMTVLIFDTPFPNSSCGSGNGSSGATIFEHAAGSNAPSSSVAASAALEVPTTRSSQGGNIPSCPVNSESNMPHQSTFISGPATNNSIPSNRNKAAAVSNPGSGTGSGVVTLGSASSSPTVALALQLVHLLQHQQQHQQQQQQHSLPWYMRTGFRHSASVSTSSNCSLDGRHSGGTTSAAGVTAAAREHGHSQASHIGLSLGAQPAAAIPTVGAPDAAVAAVGSPVQGNSKLMNVGRVSLLNPSNFFAGGDSAVSPRAAASSNNHTTD
jgi:hypothetical protein